MAAPTKVIQHKQLGAIVVRDESVPPKHTLYVHIAKEGGLNIDRAPVRTWAEGEDKATYAASSPEELAQLVKEHAGHARTVSFRAYSTPVEDIIRRPGYYYDQLAW